MVLPQITVPFYAGADIIQPIGNKFHDSSNKSTHPFGGEIKGKEFELQLMDKDLTCGSSM